jgi:Xaa-Pro aminopeptidase
MGPFIGVSRRILLVWLVVTQVGRALDRQPNPVYHMRRQTLAAKANGGAVLLFAPNEVEGPNDLYGYRPENNFFYLTGSSEPGAAMLIVPASGDGNQAYTEILFLAAHNLSQEKWTGPKLAADSPDAKKLTGFDQVEAIDDLRNELVRLLGAVRGAVYTDVPSYGNVSNSSEPLDWLKRANAFPVYASFSDVRPLISSLRTVKDSGEIDRIRKATDASIAAHLAAMRTVKPGVTEREISALMQYEWGRRGCERPAYAPIVGSGFYSTVLHYSDDSATMQLGDTVVIDAAGEYSLYASDITRTLPVSGKFTARQREIYDIVLGAQKAVVEAFRSGKSHLRKGQPDSLYDVAYAYINSHGKDTHDEPLGKYFIHGIGHFVGLGVHDEGDYDVALGPGAVFTNEPGIYIPEEKLGVRIEDILYVDKQGKLVNLTATLPHTADDVERTMAGK